MSRFERPTTNDSFGVLESPGKNMLADARARARTASSIGCISSGEATESGRHAHGLCVRVDQLVEVRR